MSYTKGEWKEEGFCVKVGDAFDAVIAECPDYRGDGLANARLIASAPDLLEACKRLMTLECMGETSDNTREIALNKAEQAISLAEGE